MKFFGQRRCIAAYWPGHTPTSILKGQPLLLRVKRTEGVPAARVVTPDASAEQNTMVVVSLHDITETGYYWFCSEGEANALVTYSANIEASSSLKLESGASAFSFDGAAWSDQTAAIATRAMRSVETSQVVLLPGNPVSVG